mgnify:CR=1 FL=1
MIEATSLESGIYKIFFPLWLAVITVRHHQIPVYILLHGIFRHTERIFTFSDIFYNGRFRARFLQHFTKKF